MGSPRVASLAVTWRSLVWFPCFSLQHPQLIPPLPPPLAHLLCLLPPPQVTYNLATAAFLDPSDVNITAINPGSVAVTATLTAPAALGTSGIENVISLLEGNYTAVFNTTFQTKYGITR